MWGAPVRAVSLRVSSLSLLFLDTDEEGGNPNCSQKKEASINLLTSTGSSCFEILSGPPRDMAEQLWTGLTRA